MISEMYHKIPHDPGRTPEGTRKDPGRTPEGSRKENHIFARIRRSPRPTASQGHKTWRINVGHNVKYYDELTFTSLVERVCLQDPSFPVELSDGRNSAEP